MCISLSVEEKTTATSQGTAEKTSQEDGTETKPAAAAVAAEATDQPKRGTVYLTTFL